MSYTELPDWMLAADADGDDDAGGGGVVAATPSGVAVLLTWLLLA